jgi:hypothetical protein
LTAAYHHDQAILGCGSFVLGRRLLCRRST